MAPLLFEYAEQGDALAQSLLRKTAADITLLIQALCAQGAPQVALLGGLTQPITPYLANAARAVLSPPQGDALDGALRMARRHYDAARS